MASREFNCEIAKENRNIVRNNWYHYNDKVIEFHYSLDEHQEVEVITPEMIKLYSNAFDHKNGTIMDKHLYTTHHCDIQVVNRSSFDVDSELVMNFANAVHPGGGYLHGANAQEETLCRQSTLYASIGSKEASEMYEFNSRRRNPMESDYMLLSPCVEVFRDNSLDTLEEPRTVAVLTVPAPNKNGAASISSQEELDQCMRNRIRGFLLTAAIHGYRKLTLGAWGCGAFGHDAHRVAGYFKQVLMDEMLARFFDRIVFAVYDHSPSQYNYHSFTKVFGIQ